MSKSDLIKNIATKTGSSQSQVDGFLKAFIESVQDSVANDEAVTLVGFGSFYRAHRKATTGRNPRTGEAIKIKAANQAKFRAGKKFKEAVNA
jgi:DNA-binding protein HU-beta